MLRRLVLCCALLPLFASAAQAAQVQSFSPQGTVKDVRQVTARFSEPVVKFGDPRLPDPFAVECAAPGKGRWADGRNWVYDFEADLPAGLKCSFKLKPGLKALSGAGFTGTTQFSFGTGGPAVRNSLPDNESRGVDEDQAFLLALDAPATATSVEAHGWCAVANLAERLPLKVIAGKERETLLAQRRLLGYSYYRLLRKDGDDEYAQLKHDALAAAEANIVAVRCARPLPPDADVDLVWGAGIATAQGMATTQDQALRFHTRAAFTARFTCDRVNAAAPCVPVLPLRLEFSAPVDADLAAKIRITGKGGTRKPEAFDDNEKFVSSIEFKPPFAESAQLKLELPKDLRDDAGRELQNAGSFPLAFNTDEAPPLVKFSGEFGILEAKEGGVLPVSMRGVENEVPAASIGGAAKRIDDEAAVLDWMKRTREAMRGSWENNTYTPPGVNPVFAEGEGALAFEIARPKGGKAFESIGIPLQKPGFYVVQVASPRLGAALLGKPQPRYVATTALVTNLAVHFKWGREGSLAFVTTLDGGKPVDDAKLRIVDACNGRVLWNGITGKNGTAPIETGLPAPSSWSSCNSDEGHPLMISARHGDDFSFVLSDWNEGIGPYDFKLDVGSWGDHRVAHTVLDRSLFRAGETVSMKHYWREQTLKGLGLTQAQPDKLVIEHVGSDQRVELPLSFDAQGIAETQWSIPKEAHLGQYQLTFQGKDISKQSGSFRVEQYRVPVMRASVTPPSAPAVAVKELPLDLYVGYFSGGGAAALPVKLRTQLRERSVSFKGYDDYRFNAETIKEGIEEGGGSGLFPEESEDAAAPAPKPGQTLPLTLDANGTSHITVPELPVVGAPQTLVAELEYPDANGELASVRSETALWPAALTVGLSTDGWAGTDKELRFTAAVLDLNGKPAKNRSVQVQLYSQQTHSYRKRLVGGFYAYSHSSETRKLKTTCNGRSDEHGLLHCKLAPGASGEILLEATVRDDAGRTARATTSAWVAGADDWWFAQGDSDRMDVIPEQREIEPGQTLKLQVRSPFRRATALVTIEREGVLDSFVTEISGRKPIIEVPMLERYAPNVFVSVLALRPRVNDFRSRFYSFLRWLRLDRWFALDGGSPTATVDLSKPAYRLGIAPVDVGWTAHRLFVDVQPQQETYKTRGLAKINVQVKAANGSALPKNAEIAFSAVDEALLDLLPNPSNDVLQAMMQRRGIEVFSATAQMQVVGKRHYGRKSLAPGGGGGRGAVRELLNSLLLWKGRVPLDAQGRASIEVPLNDALTAFRLTAVASAGADRFGSGSAVIRTTQDIQLLSGLPPLVREHDEYEAVFTVRNTTTQAQQVIVEAEIAGSDTATASKQTQTLNVPANGAAPATFRHTAAYGEPRLSWTVTAKSPKGENLDALKVAQDVIPAYPVRVYQATLLQLQGTAELPVEAPKDAIAGRGGVRVGLQSSLIGSLDGVRDWMALYPYNCLEQQASKAVALNDKALWDAAMAGLPTYLDGDGLARYFPSSWLRGSDILTAYLLAIAQEAGFEIPQAERDRMIEGLSRFAQGRIERNERWLQQDQTDRKLAAIEALSRYGQAQAAWLTSISIDANLLRTSAVIDWLGILARVDGIPNRDQRLSEARTVLRSRLNFQGTTMTFSAEKDDALWWLMISADVNANRALLAVLDAADWQEDLPRLVRGAVGRQQKGRWNLTTANAWGTVALQKFAAKFERTPVSGSTTAKLASEQRAHPWSQGNNATLDLPWPAGAATLQLAHQGQGAPWATVQSRAAIPLREPFSSGYRIKRSITPIEQKQKDRWTRGDVARVKLEIDAQSDMSWVVVEDPVPGGATLLGSGLGRDTASLTQGERGSGDTWPAFEERRFDSYRAYYAFVPKGKFSLEYTVRYNSAGSFEMPATHVEAMYSPEMLGELPNAVVSVAP